MKNIEILFLFILMHTFFLQKASANDGQTVLVPLPSIDDFTRGEDGWGLGLGIGIEYESAYEGSDEFGFEIEPAGALQWRNGNDVFFWAGEALGWRGLRNNTWLIETVISFDDGRKESDSKDGRLNGLGNNDETFQLVLQIRYALAKDWRYWLVTRAVTGEKGNLVLSGVGRRFGDRLDGTGSELNFVAVFHDQKFANQDFGINANQSATSGLNGTNVGGGFRSFGLDYNYRHNVSDKWQIIGEALYELFSGRIQDSPIARKNNEIQVGIGLLYRF